MISLKTSVIFLLTIGVILTVLACVESTRVIEENDKLIPKLTGLSKKSEKGRFSRDIEKNDDSPINRKKPTTTTKRPNKTTKKPDKTTTTTTTTETPQTTRYPRTKRPRPTEEPETTTRRPRTKKPKTTTTTKNPDYYDYNEDDEEDEDIDKDEMEKLQREQDEERKMLMKMEKSIEAWEKWLRGHGKKSLNKMRASRFIKRLKIILRENAIVSTKRRITTLNNNNAYVTI